MNTIVKNSNGISLVPLESRLLSERKLFMEEKNDSMTHKTTKQIIIFPFERP